jgi:phospholipid-binding lipoprotein MlaA
MTWVIETRATGPGGRGRGLRRGGLTMVLGMLLLAGGGQSWADTPDPLEPMNRAVFTVNDTADRWVVRPVAKGYDRAVPGRVKRGIRNMLTNLGAPGTALNQFLQGKPQDGFIDIARFVINSTVGIAGWFDVASRSGLPRHEEDFGQTFAVWGVGSGPFLMLPALGPTTARDAAGRMLDFFTNPFNLLTSDADRYMAYGISALDTRAQLLTVDGLITGDPYLFIRDAFLQRREFLIRDGLIDDDPFLDDDDYDDDDDYHDETF